MRSRSPRSSLGNRSTRTFRFFHSEAITPQQRSAATFSRLGDSQTTKRRRAEIISGNFLDVYSNRFLTGEGAGMGAHPSSAPDEHQPMAACDTSAACDAVASRDNTQG